PRAEHGDAIESSSQQQIHRAAAPRAAQFDKKTVTVLEGEMMIKYARSIAVPPHARPRLLIRARAIRLCATAVTFAALCALLPAMAAASGDPFRYRVGLRNSPGQYRLGAKQLDILLVSLREKTGFLDMTFDENGFLTLGDQTKFSGGSATARALLDAT